MGPEALVTKEKNKGSAEVMPWWGRHPLAVRVWVKSSRDQRGQGLTVIVQMHFLLGG